MKFLLFGIMCLSYPAVQAQSFSASFKDGDFCEFSLFRIPDLLGEKQCGPNQFLPYLEIITVNSTPLIKVSMNPQVPLLKNTYRVELSVPGEYNVHEKQTAEYTFSLSIPEQPLMDRIFADLGDAATAFVLAQWHAPNGESPPIALRLLNSKILAITIDIRAPHQRDTTRHILWTAPLVTNHPLNFHVRALWDSQTANGRLDVFLNAEKIVEYRGVLGQYEENHSGYYFKYGLYRSYKSALPEDFQFSAQLGEYAQTVLPQ